MRELSRRERTPAFWHGYSWRAATTVAENEAGWLAEHRFNGIGPCDHASDFSDLFSQGAGAFEDADLWGDVGHSFLVLAEVHLAERGMPFTIVDDLRRLEESDLEPLLARYHRIVRRVRRLLDHLGTWDAIGQVAHALWRRRELSPDMAEEIIRRVRPPRATLPFRRAPTVR